MTAPIGRRDAMGGMAALVASACRGRPEGVAVPRRQPTVYLPHGGGPCFYMDWTMGPADTWDGLEAWLRALNTELPETPAALLVVSAHWERPEVTLTGASAPPLLYDYQGFPPHTYELTWPAPGSLELVARVQALLSGAGMTSHVDTSRGLDHGVFVPLKLSYPEASLPTVQLSLLRSLDPSEHLALGRALAPLRREGVLLVGSGMSYHNMRGFMRAEALPASRTFDRWLTDVVQAPQPRRDADLAQWTAAPSARACHPREEHLLPLMVCAGAAEEDLGRLAFSDEVMNAKVSAYVFG